jgi:hypothetical protein
LNQCATIRLSGASALSDLNTVRPSLAALSPYGGQAHVAVWSAQQQSDVTAWDRDEPSLILQAK